MSARNDLDEAISRVPIFQLAKIRTLEGLQSRLVDFYIGDHQDKFCGNEKIHWAEQQYRRYVQYTVPLAHAMNLLFFDKQDCYRVGDLGDFLQFMRTRSQRDTTGPGRTFVGHAHRVHTWLWPDEKLSMDTFRRTNNPNTRTAERVYHVIKHLGAFYDMLTRKRDAPVVKENSLICQAHLNNVTLVTMRNRMLTGAFSDVKDPPLAIDTTLDSTPETDDGPLAITATLDSTPAKDDGPAPIMATLASSPAVGDGPVPIMATLVGAPTTDASSTKRPALQGQSLAEGPEPSAKRLALTNQSSSSQPARLVAAEHEDCATEATVGADEMIERMRDVERAIESLPEDEVDNRTIKYIEHRKRARENGDPLANAPVVFLRRLPFLCKKFDDNIDNAKFWKVVDPLFDKMSEKEYNHPKWQGLEKYYKLRPNGKGYVKIAAGGTRGGHLDHVLAKFASPFWHPRFMCVAVGGINSGLWGDLPPAERVGLGVERQAVREITREMEWIATFMKKQGMFKTIYAALEKAHPINQFAPIALRR